MLTPKNTLKDASKRHGEPPQCLYDSIDEYALRTYSIIDPLVLTRAMPMKMFC